MTLRCIIFDLDGVLCRYDLPARLGRLAELSGRAPAEIEAAIWGSGFEDRSDAGELDAEEYLTGFGERIGVRLTRDQWLSARQAGTRPDPAMLALVRRLRDALPVGMLSNNGWLTRETLHLLLPELPALFGVRLFVSAEFLARKPDPRVFRRLAERLQLTPGEILMVDDNPANVAGAIAAGWQGHHFQDRATLEQRLVQLGVRVSSDTLHPAEDQR